MNNQQNTIHFVHCSAFCWLFVYYRGKVFSKLILRSAELNYSQITETFTEICEPLKVHLLQIIKSDNSCLCLLLFYLGDLVSVCILFFQNN